MTGHRAVLVASILAAALLGGACSGGSDPTPTATPSVEASASASATASVEATPEAAWPSLGEATVTTSDLNVRAGPGTDYLVLGRLQPDDRVPVAGRADDGRWLALPGIGWAAYDETWVQLPAPWEDLPTISQEAAGFEFVSPLHPAGTSVDIPVVDQVVAALQGDNPAAVLDLMAEPAGEDAAPAAGSGDTAGDGDGAGAPPAAACQEGVQPASALADHIDEFLASEAGGSPPLRVYAVVGVPGGEDQDAEFSAVLAFQGGEARQVWLGPDGGIAWFSLGCDAAPPGEMLRHDPAQGDLFFWFRPLAPEPLDAVG